MAEDMAAEDMVAVTPRTVMPAATESRMADTAELTSEYQYIPVSGYMAASAYTAEPGWASAAELASADATTAASGTAPGGVGTAAGGGLTASAVAGEPLPSGTFGYVAENQIYEGAVSNCAARKTAP